jgi:hypothetical protein
VIFIEVEVPVAGSKKFTDRAKPERYPEHGREQWRPARDIPKRSSKAGRLIDMMRDLDQRTQDARSMLRPDAALLKAWRTGAAAG